MGKRSKYNEEEKAYALSVLDRFNGSYKYAASYLNEEGRVTITERTLQNWSNERAIIINVTTNEPLIPSIDKLKELSDDELRKTIVTGIGVVVRLINERLRDDKFSKRLSSYELVNIGNFLVSLSEQTKLEQVQSSKLNVYQQIINQSCLKKEKEKV